MAVCVSALAAEWIEIVLRCMGGMEIGAGKFCKLATLVSALAAEWIEICHLYTSIVASYSLRPRGGVD